MKWIFLFAAIAFTTKDAKMTINFSEKNGDYNWYTVVDGVMGGLSKGQITLMEESLRFTGKISLENNGGFSSIRSPYQPTDLSNYDKVTIRYKAEGQSFGLVLDTNRTWWKTKYKYFFPTTNGKWKTETVALKDFKGYSVGRATGENFTTAIAEKVIRIGIITNDKKESEFTIEIDYIEFE